MRDVAAVANCSLMTVSRALRNHPGVSTSKRQHIRQLAKELGYRPDPELSRLMRHLHPERILEPETIACLNLHPNRNHWRQDPFCKAILQGAQKNALENGYQFSHFRLEDHKMSATRFAGLLKHRGIRGLFIPPTPHGTTAVEGMPWKDLAVATCGYSLYRPRLHRACSHQYQAIRLAWQQLRQRGYCRIGLVIQPATTGATPAAAIAEQADRNHNYHMWLSGFVACQNEEKLGNFGITTPRQDAPKSKRKGQAADPLPPVSVHPSATKELTQWVDTYRPDAIIGAASLLPALEATGLNIPTDCAFAALNITGAPPHVCGVDHHMEELGAAAIDLIIEQLNLHRFGLPTLAKTVMIECDWREGSTAPNVDAKPKRSATLR